MRQRSSEELSSARSQPTPDAKGRADTGGELSAAAGKLRELSVALQSAKAGAALEAVYGEYIHPEATLAGDLRAVLNLMDRPPLGRRGGERSMTTTEALIAILRDHLSLTCGRNCEREMGQTDEDLAYSDAAAAILTLIQPGEEFLEFKEALSDLRSLRQEHRDLNGGGPDWSKRNAAAWAVVDELFANEDEAAWCRQQEDAHG